MKSRSLGRTGLQVSPIGIGGNLFGYLCDQKQTSAILDLAAGCGVNLLDTADVYSHGESERLIGHSLSGGKRPHWVIASKVGLPKGASPVGLGKKLKICQSLEASLVRLKTDYIDLYQMHHFDPETPIEETVETFALLQKQGKIRFAGCSNYKAEHLELVSKIAQEKKWDGFFTLQKHFNILKRDIEGNGIQSFCVREQTALLVYGALGRGVLTEKYLATTDSSDRAYRTRADESESIARDLTPEVLDTVQKLHDFARRELNSDVGSLVLAWALHQPAVASLILGIRSEAQLVLNIKSCSVALSKMQISAIDEIVGDTARFSHLSLGAFLV